jgi:hypothetical protein
LQTAKSTDKFYYLMKYFGGICMKGLLPRSISASCLLFSLMSSTVVGPVALSTPIYAQQQTQPKKSDKEKKDDVKKADQANKSQTANSPSPTQVASSKSGPRALSVNEDPAMIGKRSINKGFDKWMGGSQQKEVAMGRQYAAEIEKELKLVDDPMVTEYINRVGQNIVNHSDAKVPFTIKVVESDEVNAFALPGGFFYVNKGLLLAADDESELAGVMAHEIGHVAARHVVEQQGKQQLLSYGLLGAILATGGIAGGILQNTAGIAQILIGSKYSRGAEVEADKLGVQYMYAAGYDPNGMATMFEKLSAMNKKKPGGFLKLFMTHPQSTDRREYAIDLAGRFPEKEEYVLSTSEFQRVKNHLLRLSNAKATVTGDIDNSEESGKPTLRRRQPTPDDSTTTPSNTSSDKTDDKDKERPQLKRRGDPQPTPSPEK